MQADGTVSLMATTTATTNAIVKVTDAAAYDAPIAATGTTLVTAATNTVLRGIAFAPQAPAATPTTITSQPQDQSVPTGTTARRSRSPPAAATWPISGSREPCNRLRRGHALILVDARGVPQAAGT